MNLAAVRQAPHSTKSVLFLVVAVLGVMSVYAWPTRVEARAPAAIESCVANKIIPWDALDGATGAVASFAGAPFLTGGAAALSGSLTAGSAAPVAGGTTAVAAGGATGGAPILLGAAAFLGGMEIGCRYFDWLSNDFNLIPPLQTWANTTVTALDQNCTDLVAAPIIPGDRCALVRTSDPIGGLGWAWWDNKNATKTQEGVTIPSQGCTSTAGVYCFAPGQTSVDQTSGVNEATMRWRSSASTWCISGYGSGSCQNTSTTTSHALRIGCAINVGLRCGIAPGTILFMGYGTASGGQTGRQFAAVLNMQPDGRERGWQRRIVADVLCRSGGWIRSESIPYWDNEVEPRISMPMCPTGDLAIKTRVWRVPTNVTCTLGTDVCGSTLWRIYTYDLPAELSSTATAPDWSFCLTQGTDCGAPLMQGVGTGTETCVWGGFTVAESFCDPERQVDPQTAPGVQPTTDPTVQLAPRTATDVGTSPNPTDTRFPTTAEPDPDPDPDDPGTITVNVPIDNDGEDAPRPRPQPGEEGGDCWPTGWGWFNPLLWVYRPVKCVLEWAFLPSQSALEDLTDAVDAVKEKAPISWLIQIVDLLLGLADELPGTVEAHADDCVELMPDTDGGLGTVGSQPLTICPAEHSYAGIRTLMGATFWIGFAWAIYRSVTKLIGQGGVELEPQQLSLF